MAGVIKNSSEFGPRAVVKFLQVEVSQSEIHRTSVDVYSQKI
jgi:hypothetical protein